MGVQGGCQISVGATKQFGFTAQQALQECGRQVTDPQEVLQAEALLRPRAEGLWEPASSWQVIPTLLAQGCRKTSCLLWGVLTMNLHALMLSCCASMPCTFRHVITSLSKIVPCVGLIVCANWLQVGRVRSGVRALPQKTLDGALPLAGKLASSTQEHK